MILQDSKPPLFGLVLVGGKSNRMKQNKAEINYMGKSQWKNCHDLLLNYCNKVYVSTSKNHIFEGEVLTLCDMFTDSFGPLSGILTAMKKHTNVAWFVLACDMPFFNKEAATILVNNRNSKVHITAFINPYDTESEPISTIYEPTSFLPLLTAWAYGKTCPRAIIKDLNIEKIIPQDKHWLDNINTSIERDAAENIFSKSKNKQNKKLFVKYYIKYFAAMRQQSGCDHEIIKSQAKTLKKIYAELRQKHKFTFDQSSIKVSVNDSFVDWHFNLKGEEQIIFLPPIAGG